MQIPLRNCGWGRVLNVEYKEVIAKLKAKKKGINHGCIHFVTRKKIKGEAS